MIEKCLIQYEENTPIPTNMIDYDYFKKVGNSIFISNPKKAASILSGLYIYIKKNNLDWKIARRKKGQGLIIIRTK